MARLFQYQQHTEPVSTKPETVTESRWHQPWSEPLRPKIAGRLAIALMASGLFAPVLDPDTQITQKFPKWYQPLSEPVRIKPALAVALQRAPTFYTGAAPFPETVTESRWHQPWSEPVRVKQGLGAANQQVLAFNPFPLPTVTVNTGWFNPFTNPPKKLSLATASHQFAAYVGADPFPETVTESRWHQPWSEPVRTKPGLGAASQQAVAFYPFPFPAITLNTGWLGNLSDAIRRKVDVGYLQDYAEWIAISAHISWFVPLEQPAVYLKRRPVASYDTQTQVYFQQPATVSIGWYESLSEPVRVKPGLLAAEQSFLTWPPLIITPSMAGWWRPLTEPVRVKPAVTAADQPFQYQSLFTIVPTMSAWWEPYSEPVRFKSGLDASRQSFFATDTKTPSGSTVTVTFSGFETGSDVMQMAIRVVQSKPAASARVSIVEVFDGGSYTSIVEQ